LYRIVNPIINLQGVVSDTNKKRDITEISQESSTELQLAVELADLNALEENRVEITDLQERSRRAVTGDISREDKQFWDNYLDVSNLRDFRRTAYQADAGYSIRYNALTGQNEMFVAGSRKSVRDWTQNLAEGARSIARHPLVRNVVTAGSILTGQPEILAAYSTYAANAELAGDVSIEYRKQFAKQLQDQAKLYDVKVIYGHSRGAAVMSDIQFDGVKIGLDGFTEGVDNVDFINITNAGGLIDKTISKKTGRVELKGRGFHDVTKTSRPHEKRLPHSVKRVREAMAKYSKYEDVRLKKRNTIARTYDALRKSASVRKRVKSMVENTIGPELKKTRDKFGSYLTDRFKDLAKERIRKTKEKSRVNRDKKTEKMRRKYDFEHWDTKNPGVGIRQYTRHEREQLQTPQSYLKKGKRIREDETSGTDDVTQYLIEMQQLEDRDRQIQKRLKLLSALAPAQPLPLPPPIERGRKDKKGRRRQKPVVDSTQKDIRLFSVPWDTTSQRSEKTVKTKPRSSIEFWDSYVEKALWNHFGESSPYKKTKFADWSDKPEADEAINLLIKNVKTSDYQLGLKRQLIKILASRQHDNDQKLSVALKSLRRTIKNDDDAENKFNQLLKDLN